MKERRSTEDYLKTIYLLSRNGPVRACNISRSMKVSRPTVSVALKRLADEGFIRIDQKNSVALTKNGRRIAEETCEKYRLIRDLFLRLGVEESRADDDACQIEHDISSESFCALKQYLEQSQK